MTYTVTLTEVDRLGPVYVRRGRSLRDVYALVCFELRDLGRSIRECPTVDGPVTITLPGAAITIEEEETE